jgi:hypothetical protein
MLVVTAICSMICLVINFPPSKPLRTIFGYSRSQTPDLYQGIKDILHVELSSCSQIEVKHRVSYITTKGNK